MNSFFREDGWVGCNSQVVWRLELYKQILLQLPEAIFDPRNIICWADSTPVGKQSQATQQLVAPLGREFLLGLFFFFSFQHTLSHPFTLPILQAWHLLAATPPQLPGAQSDLWKARWDPVSRQLPKLSCPPLPTGWVPGLSCFHGLSLITGLSHRQLSLASLSLSFFFFWLHFTACGILVPRPGIEPMSPAVEMWILNHRTAREVPFLLLWPDFALRTSIRRGWEIQGNSSFEYTGREMTQVWGVFILLFEE